MSACAIRSVLLMAVVAVGVACHVRDESPLVRAARSGEVEELRALLADGADPNRREGVNDWTPLRHALHKGQNAAVLVLLDGGARAGGPDGAEALRMAAGYGNAAMVSALLDRGADPHLASGGSGGLMIDAVGGRSDIDYRWSGCEGHTEAVRLLLSRAPDLRVPDSVFGFLAVRKARKEGCEEMLRLLHGGREGVGRERGEVSAGGRAVRAEAP